MIGLRAFPLMLAAMATAMPAASAPRPMRFLPGDPNPVAASAPSFDCSKAAGFAERTICADWTLGTTDRSLSEVYARLLQHLPPQQRLRVRQEQQSWLRQRDACRTAHCISTLSERRLSVLDDALDRRDAILRAALRHPGDCQETRIDHIGPRLEPDESAPPQGTTVGFANGVWLVSYDREPAVLRSRIGDHAQVCLTSIPLGCPPGDARGRIYKVFNLRTRARWRLSDSSHSCGGA